jgi:hypothetical protein
MVGERFDEQPRSEDRAPEPPLSEPLIVPCLSVSGFAISAGVHVVHFVGWETTPEVEGDHPKERRIVVRFDMPLDTAGALRNALSKAIPKGH